MSMVESDSAVRAVSQEIRGKHLEKLHFDMVLSLPQVKKKGGVRYDILVYRSWTEEFDTFS